MSDAAGVQKQTTSSRSQLPPDRRIAEAHRHCQALTRAAAANFYWGIRLLPLPKRRAMCATYAFARRIDDIGDGPLELGRKRQLLDEQQQLLEHLPAEDALEDPVLLALADSMRRFPLPVDALSELIEGVRMDLDGFYYQRFEELLLYCQRVAGGIGRLSLAIFESPSLEHGMTLAEELGVAMQLTNILRDLREDAAAGRVYLPADELERFGVLHPGEDARRLGELLAEHAASANRSEIDTLMRFQARRARVWFERGIALADIVDRRSRACLLTMTDIYRQLLERIEQDPVTALRARLTLPTHQKALLATRAVLGMGR